MGGSDLVARPGKTVTGVAAKYENNRIQLRAGAIFWTDGSSNSQQDLKRRWFFAEDPAQTLEVLLRKWKEEGARGLKRHGRETAGLRIFESKKSYLAHLRKVFDVSENAFNLLNRAAGLKQLDSVDTIFRELVLDDRSGFDRALEGVSDFDTLAGIHQELEEARKQRESLLPIATDSTKLEKTEARLLEWRQVKELAPRWYAGLGLALWEVPHGLSKEGMISGQRGRFDKQDQRALSAGWLTGFDNRDRLQALARELLEAQEELKKVEPAAKKFLEERNQRAGELRFVEEIVRMTFEEIDVLGVEVDLKGLRDRLESLRAPDSETKVAQESYEEAQRKTKKHREREQILGNEVAVLESKIEEARRRVEVGASIY